MMLAVKQLTHLLYINDKKTVYTTYTCSVQSKGVDAVNLLLSQFTR